MNSSWITEWEGWGKEVFSYHLLHAHMNVCNKHAHTHRHTHRGYGRLLAPGRTLQMERQENTGGGTIWGQWNAHRDVTQLKFSVFLMDILVSKKRLLLFVCQKGFHLFSICSWRRQLFVLFYLMHSNEITIMMTAQINRGLGLPLLSLEKPSCRLQSLNLTSVSRKKTIQKFFFPALAFWMQCSL